MSGVGSALIGLLWVNKGVPLPVAIAVAIVLGAAVGAIYALLRTRLGMPSFVSTLSGLLALLGLQLYLPGSTGSINLLYGSDMVNFGQLLIMPAWVSFRPDRQHSFAASGVRISRPWCRAFGYARAVNPRRAQPLIS